MILDSDFEEEVRRRYDGVGQTVTNAVKQCRSISEHVLPGLELVDFFLVDRYEDAEKKKTVWGSAWFLFSNGAIMEFYEFLSNSSFDVSKAGSTDRTVWEYQGFELGADEIAPDSTLKVHGTMGGSAVRFELTAVGPNCRNLIPFAGKWSSIMLAGVDGSEQG